MKLVVDTNILFTFFWKNSTTKKLFLNQDLDLCSPEYSLKEINNYQEEIIKKTKITKNKFKKIRNELAIMIEFIPLKEYSSHLTKASNISPDKNDLDFFALVLKLDIPIWSNDKELKSQTKINIFSTEEIIKLIEE